jgi:hypothetical protein
LKIRGVIYVLTVQAFKVMQTAGANVETRDSEKNIVLSELRAAGLKPMRVEMLGSGHIRISWRCPEREVRQVVVAGTGSDSWPGRLNARAQVRRMLQADN